MVHTHINLSLAILILGGGAAINQLHTWIAIKLEEGELQQGEMDGGRRLEEHSEQLHWALFDLAVSISMDFLFWPCFWPELEAIVLEIVGFFHQNLVLSQLVQASHRPEVCNDSQAMSQALERSINTSFTSPKNWGIQTDV